MDTALEYMKIAKEAANQGVEITEVVNGTLAVQVAKQALQEMKAAQEV